jgi:hypothetical protein
MDCSFQLLPGAFRTRENPGNGRRADRSCLDDKRAFIGSILDKLKTKKRHQKTAL